MPTSRGFPGLSTLVLFLTLLAATAAWAAVPAAPRIQTASCGSGGDIVCEQVDTCHLFLIFFPFPFFYCTSEFNYWEEAPI